MIEYCVTETVKKEGTPVDDHFKEQAMFHMNAILGMMERLGISPPKICVSSERYIDGHTSKYDKTYENRWEPEDGL
jgi:hypothetical protein